MLWKFGVSWNQGARILRFHVSFLGPIGVYLEFIGPWGAKRDTLGLHPGGHQPHVMNTLAEFNSLPLKSFLSNRKVVFQAPFFRGELLNFSRVD